MGLVKFIRKDLFGLTAGRAFAGKRFQGFKLLETGAVLWCGHFSLLLYNCFAILYNAAAPLKKMIDFVVECFPEITFLDF